MTAQLLTDAPTARAAGGTSLTATGVRVGYGHGDVVKGVDVTMPAGQVTALVGPNGSGKSTLLRALAGVQQRTAGQVTIGDADLDHLPRRTLAQKLTLLSQNRPAPHGLTVADAVEFGRHPYRGRWRRHDPEGPAAVQQALALTGLTGVASACVDQLSGGQMQRVWLASCLAQQTAVLLLDEPTNHLDLRYQVELLDLVRDLADHHGITIGVVLHDLLQAAEVADQVILLSEGRVVASGRPGDVLTSEGLSQVYEIPVAVECDRTGCPRSIKARRLELAAV